MDLDRKQNITPDTIAIGSSGAGTIVWRWSTTGKRGVPRRGRTIPIMGSHRAGAQLHARELGVGAARAATNRSRPTYIESPLALDRRRAEGANQRRGSVLGSRQWARA